MNTQLIQVCIYGTLLRGQGNSGLLKNAVFLGRHEIKTGPMVSLGAFPALTSPKGDCSTPVELYQVSQQNFDDLDRLEGVPDFYVRSLVPTIFGQAWIYWMPNLKDTSYPLIPNNDWRKYVDSRASI